MSNIVVATRVRPFNKRELQQKAKCIVRMDDESTWIKDPDSGKEEQFTFDHSYWSFDDSNGSYASQEKVFEDLGRLYLDNAWAGYNCSLFAYGQTGAGKSYSMMGFGEDVGIIPLGCRELFRTIDEKEASGGGRFSFEVEVSFLEIYNEVIRDLLNPDKDGAKGGLRVRQTATLGTVVQGLTRVVAKSYEDIEKFLLLGEKQRTVAATNMNAVSSRSHSVFTVYFTQTEKGDAGAPDSNKVAKLNLIDLAGSERQENTGATGARLKEACSINKSLSSLSKVISALAENAKGGRKPQYVPYRDSVLTQLLQESLGGNAKTIMIAAISPAGINYKESLSTLRYASRAKKIVNKAKVNEDGTASLVKALQDEVAALKAMLVEKEKEVQKSAQRRSRPVSPLGAGGGHGGINDDEDMDDLFAEVFAEGELNELRAEINDSEKLMNSLRLTSKEKEKFARDLSDARTRELEEQGISMLPGGVVASEDGRPYIVNLNPDPQLSNSLIYRLRDGVTSLGAETGRDVVLAGFGVEKHHCDFVVKKNDVEIVAAAEAQIAVNGKKIGKDPVPLKHGDRIILSRKFVFRVMVPGSKDAAKVGQIDDFDWEDAIAEMAAFLGHGSGDPKSSELTRATMMADEANDMAHALKKKALFSVDIDQEDGNKVAIMCTNLYTGTSVRCSPEDFESRIELMKHYMMGGTGMDAEDDPFFDPPEDQLIGRAYVPLAPLADLQPIKGKFPIEMVNPDCETEEGAFLDLQIKVGDPNRRKVRMMKRRRLSSSHHRRPSAEGGGSGLAQVSAGLRRSFSGSYKGDVVQRALERAEEKTSPGRETTPRGRRRRSSDMATAKSTPDVRSQATAGRSAEGERTPRDTQETPREGNATTSPGRPSEGRMDSSRGKTSSKLPPLNGARPQTASDLEKEIEMRLQGITGLPLEKCFGVFVKYNFPSDDVTEVTNRQKKSSENDPKFTYKDRFTLEYNGTFIEYLRRTTLTFEIWGREEFITDKVDLLQNVAEDQQAAINDLVTAVQSLEIANENLQTRVLSGQKEMSELQEELRKQRLLADLDKKVLEEQERELYRFRKKEEAQKSKTCTLL